MSGSRRSAAQWRRIVFGRRQSSLSVAGYCQSVGVSVPSFYLWKNRFALSRSGVGPVGKPVRLAQPAFVEVQAVEDWPVRTGEGVGSDGAIELCLRHDRRLRVGRGFDREVLLELIALLEGMS